MSFMKSWLPIVFVSCLSTWTLAQSKESLEVLKEAELKVESKLEGFGRTDHYHLLVEAREAAASMTPRGDKARLSPLDEGSLRLQLKVLLALAKAHDPRYDPLARENISSLNVRGPLPDSNGVRLMPGANPNRINDPTARKAYEDAIAENDRRGEKTRRESALSRSLDRAVGDIWHFVRGFPANSAAKTSAFEIVEKEVADEALRNRIMSEARPGLTR